ncbi:DUF7507 domain-containing protein, partial [Belliella buryatensis]|uniref:DUF7507 domain-containing protein n=1 Tax=Belliella buryatensis TaxID=1500549 RepID=UPI001482F13C
MTDVYLVDINGNRLDEIVTECNQGDSFLVNVAIQYQSNAAADRYRARFQADLLIGNDVFFINRWISVLPSQTAGPQELILTDSPFLWSCGTSLGLTDILLVWRQQASGGSGTNPTESNYDCSSYTNSSQCQEEPEAIRVIITPINVDFDFDDLCNDFSVSFENLTSGGNPENYSYLWDFGGLGTSTDANPTFNFSSPGEYNVTLTTTDGRLTSSETKTVTVLSPLSITATKIDDDCSVEGAGTITLTNVTGGDGNYTFSWTATDGGIIPAGTENNQNQTNLSPGTYTVTVTDGRGCFNISTSNITRPNAAPAPSVFSNENYCVGSGVQGYNITADAGYSLVYYDSQTSDLPFESVPTVDTDNVASGTYPVWVAQVKDGQCESTRVEVSITVNPLPVLTITNPAAVCEPGTVDLTAGAITAGSSGFNSLAYFSDAAGLVELTNPEEISETGTYYIKATSLAGCFVIQPVEVIVNQAPVRPVSTGDITVCSVDPIQTLDANDAIEAVSDITYRWYATPTGGSEVTPTLSSIGSATFYAEAVTAEGCVSLERTPVTLTINDCSVAITKTVDFDEIDKPTTLNYTITVTNPGNTPLTGVVVTDPLTNDATPLTLASGDTNGDGNLDTDETWVFNASFVVTQAMIDAGADIVNTAFVNTDLTGEEEASVTTTITQTPGLAITKAAAPGSSYEAVGDEIDYVITVTNTGNVTLSNIAVVDPLTGLNQTIATLAPNASEVINTTYTVDQDDIDVGSVTNVATATVGDITVSDDEEVDAVQTPGLAITKAAAPGSSYEAVGDEIDYVITVTNTGNVTLSNIVVVDPLTGLNQTIATLAPNASEVINTTYTVDQDDIDAGSVTNVATATVGDITVSDDEEVDAVQNSAIAIAKSANKTIVTAAGEEVVYTLTVTNTGNTTLTDVMIVDAMLEVSENVGTLLPGQSASRDYTYTVTQSDIDNGSIVNVASTTGEDPNGDMPEDDATVTVDVDQNSAISLAKSADKSVVTVAGEEVVYTLTVTNTGNTTLTDVMLVDEMLEVSENVGTLLPGQSASRDYT